MNAHEPASFRLGLTPKQAALCQFIRGFVAARGYAPSYREMMDATGIKSTSSVHQFVVALEERGHIARKFNRNRSIVVVGGR